MTKLFHATVLMVAALLHPRTAAAQTGEGVVVWFDLRDNLARYDVASPLPQGIHLRVVRRPPTEVHVAVLTPMSIERLQTYISTLVAMPETQSPVYPSYHFPSAAAAQRPDSRNAHLAPMDIGCSGYDYPTVTVNIIYGGSVVGTHFGTFWRSYISGQCAMWSQQGHVLSFGPGGECEEWHDFSSTDGWYDWQFHDMNCRLSATYNVGSWARTSTYPSPRGYMTWYMDMLSNKTGVEYESTISGYPYYE